MANMYRDPETADRISRLGPSRVNPDVEAAMMGKKGKRPPKICPTCGEPMDELHVPHDDTTHRAEMMDRGIAR